MVTTAGLRNALCGNFIIAWLMTAVTDASALCFSRVGALNVLNLVKVASCEREMALNNKKYGE
jgi:hypothetical protein